MRVAEAGGVLDGVPNEGENEEKVVVTVGSGKGVSEEDGASEEDSVAGASVVDDMDTTVVTDDKNNVDAGDKVGADAHVIEVPYEEGTAPEEAEVNWSALEVMDDIDGIGKGVPVLVVGVPADVFGIALLEKTLLEMARSGDAAEPNLVPGEPGLVGDDEPLVSVVVGAAGEELEVDADTVEESVGGNERERERPVRGTAMD